jgi:hypothetical protein
LCVAEPLEDDIRGHDAFTKPQPRQRPIMVRPRRASLPRL